MAQGEQDEVVEEDHGGLSYNRSNVLKGMEKETSAECLSGNDALEERGQDDWTTVSRPPHAPSRARLGLIAAPLGAQVNC